MSTAENKAVFLSYASQDAEDARRICEALRAAGVEVWFDQSELRGGDAWDAKIRKQIKECALFVPVVSASTQARREGYFRIEWKLAAQRTHAIAEGTPFLLPVLLGDVAETDALVPDEFRSVQWTLLRPAKSGGQALSDANVAAFGERVRDLLDPGARASSTASFISAGGTRQLTRKPAARRAIVFAAAVVVVAGIGAVWWLKSPATKPPPVPRPTAEATASTPAPKARAGGPRLGPKSVVVLPFDNLSENKEANAFFADGMHEDLITHLLSIRELRCVPRTTAIGYRGSKKSNREIADELGVAYLLTGTVRRAGMTVRMTGTLIRADNDEPVWTKPYDKDIADAGAMFAIQAELAHAIAGELKAVLSPQERKLVDHRPTENAAAYDLYLQERQSRNLGHNGIAGRDEQERLLKAALALDPNFARAWGDLAWVNGLRFYFAYEHAQEYRAQAKTAIDRALQLAPDDPEVTLNLGYYYFYCQRDFGRAIEEFQKVARLQPQAAFPRYAVADAAVRLGRWKEALAENIALVEIDPANVDTSRQVLMEASAGRRWEVVRTELHHLQVIAPDRARPSEFAHLSYHARGSTSEMEAIVERLSGDEKDSMLGTPLRAGLAEMRGDNAEIVRLARTGLSAGAAAAALGNQNAAHAALDGLMEQLRKQLLTAPESARRLAQLGVAEAILGEKEPAFAHVRLAMKLVPESIDATEGPGHRLSLGLVYAWTGDREHALEECAHALSVPVQAAIVRPNVHVMRRHPLFFPLQGDPRFEALLDDPKNNAPLF